MRTIRRGMIIGAVVSALLAGGGVMFAALIVAVLVAAAASIVGMAIGAVFGLIALLTSPWRGGIRA